MLKASKAFKKRPVDVILDDEGKVEVKHDGHPLDVNSPGEDVSCHKNPGWSGPKRLHRLLKYSIRILKT